jgi:hypothetical protein
MGQDDFNSGALVMFMWIGTIALSIFSGVLAWDWVEPESFLGAIGFLIVWGIFSKIGHFLMFGVIYLLFDKN